MLTFFKRLKKEVNKDENVHRFALSVIRGKLLDRERKRKSERQRKREKERKKQHETSVTKSGA